MKQESRQIPNLTLMYMTEREAAFPGKKTGMVRVRHTISYPKGDYAYASYVKGDCMEARDIHDGDIIIVNTRRFPRPMHGDICVCKVDYAAPVMVKEYISPLGGGVHNVSERRFKEKGLHIIDGKLVTDQAYFASEIYGTVIACYAPDDLEHPRWEVDASELPTVLSTEPLHKSEVSFMCAASIV